MMHTTDAASIRARLAEVRERMLSLEAGSAELLEAVAPDRLASARNLIHYAALRQMDLRPMQTDLARLGLSSLGRAEPCALASVQTVLEALDRVVGEVDSARGEAWPPPPLDFDRGRALLTANADRLLGPPPQPRRVRIMVTLPSEAADDPRLVRDLLAGGMDAARINTAHDGPREWGRMVAHLRQAERELGRRCRICVDLAGPKLRTGPLPSGPAVLKIRPMRDALGRVVRPAHLWLHPAGEEPRQRGDGADQGRRVAPGAGDQAVPLPAEFIAMLRVGDEVHIHDARGRNRRLRITAAGRAATAESQRTLYLIPGTLLTIHREGRPIARARVGPLPVSPGSLTLVAGDRLLLARSQEVGSAASAQGPARVSCTLPQCLEDAEPGQRVYLDDGKIAAIVRGRSEEGVLLEITRTRPGGDKLRPDKGINMPDTDLHVPPLTADDLAALSFVADHADMVGFSFVQRPQDVHELQDRLARLTRRPVAIVLKIETRRAFENLISLLLASMRGEVAGVMIARGDLAVESGWERLAEVQEQILWLCEAAHTPVIWATQVLETLAKTGMPSRAEITDAAMGERAECVMLNKGPYIAQALRTLDDILRRMADHQRKKTPMLRALSVALAIQPDPEPQADLRGV